MEETQPPFLLLPLFSPFLYEWKIIAYQSPILSLLYLSKILPIRIVTFSIRIFLRSWKRIPKLYLFRKIQNPSFQDYRGNFGKFPFLIEFPGRQPRRWWRNRARRCWSWSTRRGASICARRACISTRGTVMPRKRRLCLIRRVLHPHNPQPSPSITSTTILSSLPTWIR